MHLTQKHHEGNPSSLNRRLVGDGGNCFRLMARQLDCPLLSWLHWLSLEVQLASVLLRLRLLLGIALHTAQEVLARATATDMFDADVDALLEVSVTDWLVEDDTDGRFGDVVDDARLSVVVLVRHALLYGTVADHVDDVSDSVLLEIDRHVDAAGLLETS